MKFRIGLLMVAATLSMTNMKAEDGSAVFKQNCAACHSVGKGKLVGPDLKGAHEKFEKPWLKDWIRSSQALVKKKDPIAVKLFEENNMIPMPDQALSDEQLEALITFLEEETTRLDAPAIVEAPKENTGTQKISAEGKTSESSGNTATYIFAGTSFLMLIIIAVLGNIIKEMGRALKNKTN